MEQGHKLSKLVKKSLHFDFQKMQLKIFLLPHDFIIKK